MTTAQPSTKENPLGEKVLDAKVKLIIKTVLERCKKESDLNSLVVPIHACEQRASYYTAFPTTCFFELNEIKNQPQSTFLGVREKLQILNSFKDLYSMKMPMTIKQVHEIFTKHKIVNDFDPPIYVRRELCSMGYEYKNTQYGPLLVENSNMRYERFNYLSKIIRFRNKSREIYYVEVRIIDKCQKFQRSCSSSDDNGDISKYYYLHAISRNGFINGIFCNVMDRDIFTRWITDVLITMLAPNSLIVINNGELFNEKINSITRYTPREDMVQWLHTNNIPCSSGMYKPELYELIMKSGIKHSEYKIDSILKAHGHNILRLPQKFEDLTPAVLLWQHVKTEQYHKDLSLIELKCSVERVISNIEKLKWLLFSDTVLNWEMEIFETDAAIENLLDEYKFDTENVFEPTIIPDFFFTCDEVDMCCHK